MRVVLTTLSILVFLFLGVPCLFAGALGVMGVLADTSYGENLQAGIVLLGLGLLGVTPLVLCVFLWRPRASPEQGRPGSPPQAGTEHGGGADTGRGIG
jgi:hypothetical protein